MISIDFPNCKRKKLCSYHTDDEDSRIIDKCDKCIKHIYIDKLINHVICNAKETPTFSFNLDYNGSIYCTMEKEK